MRRLSRPSLTSLPSVRLGRLLGVPFELNASWFLVFLLVVAGLSFGYFPEVFQGRPVWLNVVQGVVAAILFFGSVALHELAHSVVAMRAGLGVDRVTLFLLGGVSQLTEEPRTPGAEVVMAIAGPGASIVLALVSFGLYAVLAGSGLPDAVWAPLPYLAQANALVAAFNLLPGFPMDGGRLVRALLWWGTGDKALATRVAATGGQVVGWGLVAVGLAGAFLVGPGLAWLCLLGLFIRSLAARSGRVLAPVVRRTSTRTDEVMRTPADTRRAVASARSGLDHERVGVPPRVDASDSLDVAARLLGEGFPVVWVVRDGRLVGEIMLSDVRSSGGEG